MAAPPNQHHGQAPMTFNFGKHKDVPLPDVPTHYLRWALGENDSGQPVIRNESFRREVQAELGRRDDGGDCPTERPNESRGHERPHERPAYTPHPNAPIGTAQWMTRTDANRAFDEMRSLLIDIKRQLTAIEQSLAQPAANDDTPF